MTDPLVPLTAHLTEAERQCAADGTLGEDERAAVARHLAACAECAADVARLAELVAQARGRSATDANLPDLWPAIRERIEHGKVIALDAREAPVRSEHRRSRARGKWWLAGGVAAAAAAILAVATLHGPRPRPTATPESNVRSGDRAIIQVTDSARMYEQQLLPLLEELELRRSMLPPETATALDHDLRLIDEAIAELQEALKQDPNNTALRQLLAASYRQKRDLLRLVDNAS
jgi:hypothetical protein